MEYELHWRLRLALAASGLAAFALFHLLARAPALAESIYGRGLGPLIASALSSLTGIVPVSLAEILVVLFVGRQLLGLARGIDQVRNRDRRLLNALAAGLLRLAADAGVVVAAFYLVWGFNYARPALETREQWNGAEADVEEVARLAQELIEAANFEYASITGSDDSGMPTIGPQHDELIELLASGWEASEATLPAPGSALFGFGPPKGLWASALLDYGQSSGFYFPWTGEANYNRGTPDVSMPHVIAHEMAHQRGFAREDEANFVGFLVASLAGDPYLRYSAYVFGQRQLLTALGRHDRDRARGLAELRLPGVGRDIRAADEYWRRFDGPTGRATRSMNNAFLRGNRIPDGILSYGRSVELLIAYARSRGGWLVR